MQSAKGNIEVKEVNVMDVLEIIEEVIHDEAAELRRENEQLKQKLYRLHAELADAQGEMTIARDKLREEKERHSRMMAKLMREHDRRLEDRDNEIWRLKYTLRVVSGGGGRGVSCRVPPLCPL